MKNKKKDYKKVISDVLKELGIPASILGYHYVRYAIALMMKDMSLVSAITKKLYPAVAKQYNTTTSKVERAIRHAVETGWLRGNEDLTMKIFGYSYSADKGKPTNGEFIANIADYIILNYGELI